MPALVQRPQPRWEDASPGHAQLSLGGNRVLQMPCEGRTGEASEGLFPQTFQRFSRLEVGDAKVCHQLLTRAQDVSPPALLSHPPGLRRHQSHRGLEADDVTCRRFKEKGHLQLPRIPGGSSFCRETLGHREKLNTVL